jgi:ribosomal protein L3 glutamine methyltransferase
MDFIRALLAQAPQHLSEHGVLVLEIGHERPFLHAAFPRLEGLWLHTQTTEDQVLLLTREALAAGLTR